MEQLHNSSLKSLWLESKILIKSIPSKFCKMAKSEISSVNEKRETDQIPALLNIGRCELLTIYGSMKVGAKSADWNIGKILETM